MGIGGKVFRMKTSKKVFMARKRPQYFKYFPVLFQPSVEIGGKVFRMKTSKKAFMARKRPLYYTCFCFSPALRLLAKCSA